MQCAVIVFIFFVFWAILGLFPQEILLAGGKPGGKASQRFVVSNPEPFEPVQENYEDWSITSPVGMYDSTNDRYLLLGGYDVTQKGLFDGTFELETREGSLWRPVGWPTLTWPREMASIGKNSYFF